VVSAVRSKALAALAVLVIAAAPAFAAGPAARMEQFVADPHDATSLQRGARLFVNYCLNCHSAKYMRYNRLAGIGLTDGQIADNLIFAGSIQPGPSGAQYVPTKIGDTMQVAMRSADAKAWFGAPPPDLSVETRVRGVDWVYNYLLGFYRDPQSATGWNNLVFPNVGMPHVLWELSGTQRLVTAEFPNRAAAEAAAIGAKGLALVEPGRDRKYVVKTLAEETRGTLTPAEYRRAAADLVNFMGYVAEPAKLQRERLGLVVLLFLGVLFVLAYWLKREYWKDVH
jgi:ubiquinol-cytochrome c reductase cytochrome c1 subunit